MKDFCIIIPAIKKNAVIPDQLVKKLNGQTLIQRAIDVSKEVANDEDIYVITDSQEIALICERNNIKYFYDAGLNVNTKYILDSLEFIFEEFSKKYEFFLLNRANTPLVNSGLMKEAISFFRQNEDKLIVSVKKERRRVFKTSNGDLNSILFDEKDNFFEEVNAFQISRFDSLKNKQSKTLPYVLPTDIAIEIDGYQSWWICEKLLSRKRIVFNVIGSIQVGMGHIYRCLALAHEITNHEIIFVCDDEHEIVVEKIASTDYRVLSCKKDKLIDFIIDLKPDLVINDILNSEEEDILKLKEKKIQTVNFEDLGSGSSYADIVINELYDVPQLSGSNYYWGHDYFILRDEFIDAKPHSILEPIASVLITFGGTDQNDLTRKILELILPDCIKRRLEIYIVCGSGYNYKNELEKYIEQQSYDRIEFTYAAGAISKIMEKTQIAISSNGRTVYELADMNIPSIILSHHEREDTHTFACLENGFVNMGVYNEANSNEDLLDNLIKLVDDYSYRKLLFLNIKKYNFRSNKSKVLNMILSLIEN
jgi:spore coat polysaccharide biosynthesis predicted glycosyltransferase SpsG/CMP-N-acetylneuraminic acid synthetase